MIGEEDFLDIDNKYLSFISSSMNNSSSNSNSSTAAHSRSSLYLMTSQHDVNNGSSTLMSRFFPKESDSNNTEAYCESNYTADDSQHVSPAMEACESIVADDDAV